MENKQRGFSQKAIIYNNEGKILIIRRSKTSPTRAGFWDLPGGVLEDGEDKKEAIIREIKEETDLDVKDLLVSGKVVGPENDISWEITCYFGAAPNDDVKLSYEHDDFKWIMPEEFESLEASDTHKKFVKEFISLQNGKK